MEKIFIEKEAAIAKELLAAGEVGTKSNGVNTSQIQPEEPAETKIPLGFPKYF